MIRFIDIPRTGSTSLRHALELDHRPRHESFATKIDKYGWQEMKDAFVFSFVRNPWYRTVSLWSICDGRDGLDFLSFLRLRIVGEVTYRNPVVPDREYWPHIFDTQCQFLDSSMELDFLGRFENREQDIEKLFKELNLGKPETSHLARGRYKKDVPLSYHYCDEAKEIVFNKYEEDFHEFDYDTEFPDE